MTPQEKLDCFWSIGELPGTIFDDLNDRKPKAPVRPSRRRARRLRLGSRKRHEEALEHEESSIDLRRRS